MGVNGFSWVKIPSITFANCKKYMLNKALYPWEAGVGFKRIFAPVGIGCNFITGEMIRPTGAAKEKHKERAKKWKRKRIGAPEKQRPKPIAKNEEIPVGL